MLDLECLRRMANQHDFEEVQFNQVSRVIAFEKDAPGAPRCRVNVYYTTGTVATCLDHPRSGKTQLFRRGQTPGDLDAIFRNPRQHTGVGYFRNKGGRANWQPVDGRTGARRNFCREECDDARRWRFVHSTQEGFCNERQADQIAALCKLWHQLRFAPPNGQGIVTTAEKFNSMDPAELEAFNDLLTQAGYSGISICEDCEVTGCKCNERAGSWCSLMSVVGKVARDMDGVVGLYNKRAIRDEAKQMDIHGIDHVINCQCEDGLIFRQRHSTFLQKLERQFRSFPPRIRRELVHWFTSKHMHGYEPFMINPGYNPDIEGDSENFPVDLYGSFFCSNEILQAHHDYGEMAYGAESMGCACHGI